MNINLEELISYAKRRGFVYTSSDIYGGFAGVYDYGPFGVELLNNIKKLWWREMVWKNHNIVGLDSAIAMKAKIWEVSGHTSSFNDPVVTCKKTGKKFRVDNLLKEVGVEIDENASQEKINKIFKENKEKLNFENCDLKNISDVELTNLLVETNIGRTGEQTYLRGETAQGIYVNYKNVFDSMHLKIPFGIAQIGKAFRNEISPRQFLFRTREFEQMEMQYFVNPKELDSSYENLLEKRFNWLVSLGIDKKNLRKTPHENLVFYAKKATDIEYKFPFGWGELEGIHSRGDYDLKNHSNESGCNLEYTDPKTNEIYTPNVVETSIGLGRLFLTILSEAYTEERIDEDTRIVLKLDKELAPVKVAILPLMKKEDLVKKAKEIFTNLSGIVSLTYDETGSIGKRYRRQDEIGTPYCITIDYDTIEENNKVTFRDRDTMTQENINVDELEAKIKSIFK